LNPGGQGQNFHTHPDWPWGPPNCQHNGYRVSPPGVQQPECGIDHSPTSIAKVNGSVELYLYSPSGPSQPVLV